MSTKIKSPKGHILTLNDLWDIIKKSAELGLPMDSTVRFSMCDGFSFIVSDEEWNNAKIDPDWNDKDDPEDMKKTYKIIEKMNSLCELDGSTETKFIITIDSLLNNISIGITNCMYLG